MRGLKCKNDSQPNQLETTGTCFEHALNTAITYFHVFVFLSSEDEDRSSGDEDSLFAYHYESNFTGVQSPVTVM